MKGIYSIYFDTNCINAKGKDSDVSNLDLLFDKGVITFQKTDVVDTELAEGGYLKGLLKSARYVESMGPAVFGNSRFDHSVIGSDEDGINLVFIIEAVFGKKKASDYSKREIRDAMHLLTAGKYGGNFFVTYDKKILKVASEIRSICGVLPVTPKECLNAIGRRLEFLKKHEIEITKLIKKSKETDKMDTNKKELKL